MSYKKVFPKTSLKKADVLAAEGAFNVGCFVSDGKVVPAINSVTQLSQLNEKATAAWYSATVKKYILFTQNRIYRSTGTPNSVAGLSFAARNPSMVESWGTSKAAYVIGDSAYYFFGSLDFSNPFRGNVFSCILKNGRIFGIDYTIQNKIKWSGEGGVDDWTESISGAGWATVQHGYGSILNLVVYKDIIVAVREYGLTFLHAHGTPENYRLSYLESKLPKIFKNTAAVVGTVLAFYTEDGLYIYDGNKAEKCSLSLAEEIQSPVSVSCAKGKYFLCGTSKTLKKVRCWFTTPCVTRLT